MSGKAIDEQIGGAARHPMSSYREWRWVYPGLRRR
jgi:hypothetical protein